MNITIQGLTKIYPNRNKAIEDINLHIESGVFGLLGPNGAGKTTLMRILATLMKPTSGVVNVDGLDLQRDRRAIRAVLGYLPQDFHLFSRLKTWEFLDYVAGLAGLRDRHSRGAAVDEMLEQVGLYEARDRQASKLSSGMKRRLGIAQALIGDPQIVIVDEPTTGLDPEERIRFRNLLSDMSQRNIIVILSTHIVGDISSTCGNMALLNKGQVAFQGPPDELIEQAKDHVWKISAMDGELESINQKYPVVSTVPSENGWEVQIVADRLDTYPGERIDPNLEHAYVYFMEYKLHEAWRDGDSVEL